MGLYADGALYYLFIQGMAYIVDDGNHDGFIHFIANNLASPRLS